MTNFRIGLSVSGKLVMLSGTLSQLSEVLLLADCITTRLSTSPLPFGVVISTDIGKWVSSTCDWPKAGMFAISPSMPPKTEGSVRHLATACSLFIESWRASAHA